MKLFLRMILIGLLTYFLSPFSPWWIIVIISLLTGLLLPGGVVNSFVSGFLGVSLVWMGYAWQLDTENASVFSGMILEIIPLGDTQILIVVVGLIGGFTGGVATVTGSLLRKRRKERPYDR